MTQPPSGAPSDSGSRNPRPSRRHACDRCRSQKLRCDRTTHRQDTSIACDRCARNHFACVTSAPMPMGRPRSLNPKPRYRRRTSKTSGDLGSKDTGTDSSTPPSCSTVQPSPNLTMAGMKMDAINNLPELVFNQEDLGYGLGFPNGDVFDPTAFADLDMSSQPAAVGPTESAAANPQEQKVECLWKLHSTLLDHVYRIESQAINQIDPSKNESLPDTHPFGPQFSDIANTQSDHPMHQMMCCSQTFLEIVQSFVSSYRQSVCSIPPPECAVTDCSRDSDDEYLRYPGNPGPASFLNPNTSFSSTVPPFDKSPAISPSTELRGDQRKIAAKTTLIRHLEDRDQPFLSPARPSFPSV
ncbi:Zn(II)2Cys6 transcription factor domain-containing protein [Aspergillus aculeatinus CBS 121060]|uniref:Uncharacterized protein n=1 Tax=Aspergillus aculeatinus CBS 121060 TaxID=1448322 RepID=A0ACD1HMM3_9EURO|nr:hypothetical protein BO66DRAFT_71687 [Aspergillus aculeatinus CBS 121060]RAH75068.1 hypothetical protein BO66DRAFT_71687 [Aspergillus aculeatinus CBS 121060]